MDLLTTHVVTVSVVKYLILLSGKQPWLKEEDLIDEKLNTSVESAER